MTHLQPGALLQGGKYRIEKFLGQGGFGITYLGWHVSLNSRVAVKEFFMKDHCDRNPGTHQVTMGTSGSRELVLRFREKFIKEARHIYALSHPHIVRVIDVFEENGTAYYVMDYLGGGTLQDAVQAHGALSVSVASGYIRQVASALDYIHGRNLLHLDVKPSNIMLNDSGEAILVDFGVSKRYDESGHQTSSTPLGVSEGYAPIEQYESGGMDQFSPSTDIYSLGATFYYLLTGSRPPKASALLSESLSFPDGIPEGIRACIVRSMAPGRKDRPQSMGEFLRLLETAMDGSGRKSVKDEETVLDAIVVESEVFPKQAHFSFSTKGLVAFVLCLIFSLYVSYSRYINEGFWGIADSAEFSGIIISYIVFIIILYPFLKLIPKYVRLVRYLKVILPIVLFLYGCTNLIVKNHYLVINGLNYIFLCILIFYVFGLQIKVNQKVESEVSKRGKLSGYEEGTISKGMSSKRWFVSVVISLLVGLGAYLFWERQSSSFDSPELVLSDSQGRINGHDYVDLGLPSGLKWATCNVGASRPEDYGDYFAWGEIKTKSEYTDENSLTYGKDIGNISGNSQYDVASAQWGSSWRLPILAEIEELEEQCTWKWIAIDGHKGYRVIGPNGNSIFLPAAGYRSYTNVYEQGSYGAYWSGTLFEGGSNNAYCLYFDDGGVGWSDHYRGYGHSVRPVSE